MEWWLGQVGGEEGQVANYEGHGGVGGSGCPVLVQVGGYMTVCVPKLLERHTEKVEGHCT